MGSAAAVAASLAMFAIGTETQNSIQTPAAYSSVVGYKPSVGRVSCEGIFPLVPSQDTPGPITRSVADASLVAAVIAGAKAPGPTAGSSAGLAGMRIGVPRMQTANRPEFEHLMPLFEHCLSRLSLGGATVVDPCDLPSAERLQALRSCVFRTEFKAAFDVLLQQYQEPAA